MRLDYTFGIEIECYLPEGSSAAACATAITERGQECHAESWNHTTRPHWKIVTDGSLGDYVRGIEIVSPILSGEAGFAAVRTVMDALDDFGCTVSKKCGLHVHVGVGNDANLGFFKNLLKHYAHFEPVLDALMPASRRRSENNFCRSMTSASFAAIDRATSVDALLNLYTRHTAEQRYYKLNLCAYRRYRTVEFRQHSGTLAATKACNWISLCLRIVDAAKAGKTVAAGRVAGGGTINRARRGSKAHIVGQLLLRPEGVTRSEAMAATGWPAISLPQQAKACGLGFTTQRTGNEVRYFAQATAPSAPTPVTLDGMLAHLECDHESDYFRQRAANLAGSAQWAA